jgi:enoyl-CoA hydratase/carnithine racemase
MAVVEYQKEGKIAYFTLNRPEAFNSINVELFRTLSERMAEFREDNDVWVGIITGSGSKAFSAGADIKEMLPFLREHKDAPWASPPAIMRGMDMWKPLIAAVNGLAYGGGLEIVMACDLRIAAETARFATPEVTLGLIPGWGGTQRLPRMIAYCKAAELVLMGKPFDAQEAYRVGLINKVVPADQLMATAREWAETMCKSGPLALRAAKEAMIRGSSMSLDDGLRLENTLNSYLTTTSDFNEGITAFAAKRKPEYKAK